MVKGNNAKNEKSDDIETSINTSPSLEKNRENVVSISYLKYCLIFFLIGIGVTLFTQHFFLSETITFSTSELINFTFSIALSGASIILAIEAIHLGKKSEQILLMQSNESIHLQNELFIKTNDVLQKIGTSTGVTEKRIEDIISGRIKIISENIADEVADQQLDKRYNIYNLRKSIENSLREGLKRDFDNRDLKFPEYNIKRKRTGILDKYYKFQNSILDGLANLNKYTVIKIKNGDITGRDNEIFDGIFIKDHKKFSVGTFLIDSIKSGGFTKNEVKNYYETIFKMINSRNFYKAFIVTDYELSDSDIFKIVWDELSGYTIKEITDNVIFLHGTFDEIAPQIEKELQ